MDRRPLVIACLNFPPEEVQSAHGLLKILSNFLPTRCRIAEEGEAGDLYLVNLDAEASQINLPSGAYTIGCSVKPRNHPPGTIHRPIRPSAMLAVVSDFVEKRGGDAAGEKPKAASGNNKQDDRLEWSYQLLMWPLDFQQMPEKHWRVLAFLAHHKANIAQVAEATELDQDTVATIVQHLTGAGCIERYAASNTQAAATFTEVAEPPPPPSGWRKLANRMGKLLGFG